MPSAVEQAVQARIAAARARIARQQADRATRARRRAYGLRQRHAAKLRHQDAAGFAGTETSSKGLATTETPDPQETDPC